MLYKGTVFKRIIGKMTIKWVIFLQFLCKISCKKRFGSHNMTMLYPNLCYNKVSYKRTTLYLLKIIIHQYIKYTNYSDSVVQMSP